MKLGIESVNIGNHSESVDGNWQNRLALAMDEFQTGSRDSTDRCGYVNRTLPRFKSLSQFLIGSKAAKR